MTEIYTNTDLEKALKQRKRLLITYFVVFGVFLVLSLIIFIFYLQIPYGESSFLYQFFQALLSLAFVVFSFVFLSIKLKRVRKYCKQLKLFEITIPQNFSGKYLRTESGTESQYDVDFYRLYFSCYNESKKVYYERKVLLDAEKPKIDFLENETVEMITKSNILVSYKRE